MIIRINGRVIYPEPVPVMVAQVPEVTDGWREKILHWMNRMEVAVRFLFPPPGALLAAAPVGGLTGKLWPLIDKLQEFGLAAAIAVSLWGLCRVIMGDPSGKQTIWQALIGFIGLFIIPEVFFAIWEAFR